MSFVFQKYQEIRKYKKEIINFSRQQVQCQYIFALLTTVDFRHIKTNLLPVLDCWFHFVISIIKIHQFFFFRGIGILLAYSHLSLLKNLKNNDRLFILPAIILTVQTFI